MRIFHPILDAWSTVLKRLPLGHLVALVKCEGPYCIFPREIRRLGGAQMPHVTVYLFRAAGDTTKRIRVCWDLFQACKDSI